MKPLEVAQLYFDLSNKSNFNEITKLFSDTIKYSSQNTGVFSGKAEVIAMQKNFHSQFTNLQWSVNSIAEEKTGVILVDYDFKAIKSTGEEVKGSGLEYVTVHDGKITHILIRNS